MIKFIILLCSYTAHELHYTPEEIRKAISLQKIKYNSALRFKHVRTGHFLHSEEIRYTKDNEKFPVTVGQKNDQFNTLWVILAGHKQNVKNYQEFLRCDDIVTLNHLTTKKFLFMDTNPSFLSKKFDVATNFDETVKSDNHEFQLECVNQDGDSVISGTTLFRIKNLSTSGYLHANPSYNFNSSNCGRVCPIMGHFEVSGIKVEDSSTTWQVHSGVFIQSEERQSDKKWIYEMNEEMDLKPDEDL